jgi:hypothetical protein
MEQCLPKEVRAQAVEVERDDLIGTGEGENRDTVDQLRSR